MPSGLGQTVVALDELRRRNINKRVVWTDMDLRGLQWSMKRRICQITSYTRQW